MTKKHYIALAAGFKKARPSTMGAPPSTERAIYLTWVYCVEAYITVAKQDNSAFDIDIFRAACGMTAPTDSTGKFLK